MSNHADDGVELTRKAFTALEGAVGQALARLETMTERAAAAEAKSADLNDIMARFTSNPAEAGDVLSRLQRLEEENADLRGRLERGREGVDRLLARIRFLENQQ